MVRFAESGGRRCLGPSTTACAVKEGSRSSKELSRMESLTKKPDPSGLRQRVSLQSATGSIRDVSV